MQTEDEQMERTFSAEVIAIINQKGGVGKSTTAINLAACLGDLGKRVLVVDLDPQGNATSGFGVDKDKLEADVYDSLMNDVPLSEVVVPSPVENVDVAPATIQLAGAEIELVSVMARESVLRYVLDAVRDRYDYVFVDCPPSLGLLTVNALVAADSLLIPIQCEFYALEGLSKLLESMRMVKGRLNRELRIFGVVMTMFDARTTLSRQVVAEVRDYFGEQAFDTVIPRNIKLSEAPSHGLPANLYAPTSAGAQAYAKLAQEVIERG
ncbi:MAG: AAA family ATPase [Coriobacteriales bacterium]|nr:AAA family ATPase [Coriobacteriales bacterium]